MKRKNVKRLLSVGLASAMVLSLAACGSSSDSGDSGDDSASGSGSSDGALELAYNLSTEDLAAFKELIAEFTEETGIEVSIYEGGADYEALMKTRMSSGDLPDMWVTHGWSLIRYSEYMMDLSDQDWVDQIDAGLKEVITNDDGELFILPITQALCAVVYNEDVLAEAGVDPTQIRTWDDFDAACQQILDNTDAKPIGICQTDSYNAYPLECIWPSLYTNEGVENNRGEDLNAGTFDWTTDGLQAFEMTASWAEKGYFNEDMLSGQKDDVCKGIANGEIVFSLNSTNCIPSILAFNGDANIGIIPIPAASDDAPSGFSLGEGNYSCFGIYKDTEYEDECKQLLEFLDRPENATKITQWDGGIPALDIIELSEDDDAAYVSNKYKIAQEQFEGDLCYDNFFDREYLPSGMWSVMKDAIATLLSASTPSDAVGDAAGMIAENYNDLMGN